MKNIIKIGLILAVTVLAAVGYNHTNNRVDTIEQNINGLKVLNPQDVLVGGITRTAIGAQTKWTTDLIPSASFNVNLGSLTLPVQKIFAVGASLSGNFAFLGEIKPDNVLCSNGEILKKTAANDWDCAADATGGSGSGTTLQTREGYTGTFNTTASLSFNPAHFILNSNGVHASLSLDWGTGGPASLSQAETITGNWVNTANPWADDEVIDTITASNYLLLAGGTLTGNLIGTGASFSVGEFTSYASASAYRGSGFTADCDATGSQLLWDTTTGRFTCETLVDADIPDTITASNYLLLSGGTLTGNLIGTGASFSTGEFSVYASASKFQGSAFTGVGTCTGSSKLLWASGVFSCGTDDDVPESGDFGALSGGTGITFSDPTISFDATELDALTWDAGTLSTFAWTYNLTGTDPVLNFRSGVFDFTGGVSVSANLEVSAVASISAFRLPGTAGGTLGDCDAAGDTLNWDTTTGKFTCGSDTGGSVSSNSLNFDEFQNPLVLDTGITITSGSNNWDWNGTHLLDIGQASVSLNLETNARFIAVTASISKYHLPLTTGGTLGDCDAAGDTLNWDASTERFICGTDASSAGSGVTSNSLDYDEFVNSMTLDANLTINRNGFFFGIGGAPSTVFEVNGTASASYGILGVLQVGISDSPVSLSFSRFGINDTGHSLTDYDDVLISGLFEVDDNAFFDLQLTVADKVFFNSTASVGQDFEVGNNVFRIQTQLVQPDTIFSVESNSFTAFTAISSTGHEITDDGGGPGPTVSSCGTTPSIAGNDILFKVTVGSGVTTSCTVTFDSAYASNHNVICMIHNTTSSAAGLTMSSSQSTLIIASTASMGSHVLWLSCKAYVT